MNPNLIIKHIPEAKKPPKIYDISKSLGEKYIYLGCSKDIFKGFSIWLTEKSQKKSSKKRSLNRDISANDLFLLDLT